MLRVYVYVAECRFFKKDGNACAGGEPVNFVVSASHLHWQMKSIHLVKAVTYCLDGECWIPITAQGLRCICFNDFPALFNMGLCFMGRHAYRLPVTSQTSNTQSVFEIWLNPSSPCVPPVNFSYVIYGTGPLPVSCVCFVGCSAVTMPSLEVQIGFLQSSTCIQSSICLRWEFLEAEHS